jgi:Domain of unknown function (DUF4184)
MPLTFAHPAVVLVFSRKSKYINFSALVLGSMAPDFEYFLRGRPAGEIGHELPGFFFFNLPLAALVYFIYHTFIHRPLMDHLPWFLQDTARHKQEGSLGFKFIVFCYSACLECSHTLPGMLLPMLMDLWCARSHTFQGPLHSLNSLYLCTKSCSMAVRCAEFLLSLDIYFTGPMLMTEPGAFTYPHSKNLPIGLPQP